jgi:hypothetical protein
MIQTAVTAQAVAQLSPLYSFSREALLARGVAEIGEAWARHVVLCLHDRHRCASGAWSGTLGEARLRAATMLEPWLWSRGRVQCQPVELAYAAFEINHAARRTWAEIRDASRTSGGLNPNER